MVDPPLLADLPGGSLGEVLSRLNVAAAAAVVSVAVGVVDAPAQKGPARP